MKNIKKSLICNTLIVTFVLIGSIFMFCGITFMKDVTLLESSNISMFRFYTVDSNILIGLISFIFIIYEFKLLKNKIKEIPKFIYILKLIGTCTIALTFFTTLLFLAPQYGFYAMYNNNNIFLHLLVPLLSLITYCFYEKHDNKYIYALYGIIPMFIYSIYYMTRVLIHLNNDGLSFKYDFYGFLNGNINNIFIVVPVIYLFTYIISILIIKLNKKNNNGENNAI